MRASFVIPFFCLATVLNTHSHAQEEVEKKMISSKSITVIATKNPQNSFEVPLTTAKIDMSDAQYQNSTTLSDIFANTTGVEIQGGPVRNAQQFSMRGYDANGIIFLLDGTRQNFSSGHNSNIYLDPSLLKQVEIVKGSSSAVYGSGGLGGVISFETKDAKDLLKDGQKLGFMQKFGYFSGNHEQSSVSTLYGASEKVDAIANVTYRDAGTLNLGDGTKYNAADSRVKSGMFKVNYTLSDNQKLKFNVQSYKNDSDEFTNPSLNLNASSAVLSDKTTTSTTTKLAHEFNPNEFVNLSTQVYQVDTKVGYDYTSGTAQTRNFDLQTRGFDIHNVSNFISNENFTNRVTYGLNYFQDDIANKENNASSFFYPDGKSSVVGIFVQDEAKAITEIGEFSVIPSIRFDRYDTKSNNNGKSYDDALSPRLAVGYMPQKWLNVFTSASKAFRAPTISEKYLAGSHYGIAFLANPNLEAEKNTTYEGGFGLRFSDIIANNDNINFKATYFHTDAKDFI